MDSQETPNRRGLLEHLQGLVKASTGALVIATATVATTAPAPASASSTAGGPQPTIARRVEEIRKQTAIEAPATESTEPDRLLAWGNWHNWRNGGWHNGWHNWRNWHNW